MSFLLSSLASNGGSRALVSMSLRFLGRLYPTFIVLDCRKRVVLDLPNRSQVDPT